MDISDYCIVLFYTLMSNCIEINVWKNKYWFFIIFFFNENYAIFLWISHGFFMNTTQIHNHMINIRKCLAWKLYNFQANIMWTHSHDIRTKNISSDFHTIFAGFLGEKITAWKSCEPILSCVYKNTLLGLLCHVV